MFEIAADVRKNPSQKGLSVLALAALGIVFGDIGTSPLYTFKTILNLAGEDLGPKTLLGLLSLIIWTLIVTVSVKYVTLVMRADNDGEGGILALMSLLRKHRHHRPVIIALGLFGASLIYGDGAITPAISVLSAIEGLKISAPHVAPYVLPISVVVLLALFAVQSQGTARIGWIFGPIMALWFIVIGALGVHGIIEYPNVLLALNPYYAFHYFFSHGFGSFIVLGGVFLAVTGAEALYADMGPIGVRPIRWAWYGLVLPALILNYAGQTAVLLNAGISDANIFYRLCPDFLLWPMIGLSTLATIIASQAIITGAFAMTRQAIHLDWCPRLEIIQTSPEAYDQIYIGVVNWTMMITTIGLTIVFGSSDNLASAYGIAVSLTMLLTTALLFVAAREVWKWNLATSLSVAGLFFCIDLSFFGANALKIMDGGWVPLVLAGCTYTAMLTWRRGSVALAKSMHALTTPVSAFMDRLKDKHVARVAGTAVFLSKTSEQTPPLIIWQVAHNKSLHEHIAVLSVVISHTPWIEDAGRFSAELIAPNFWRLIAHYGFMEHPNIPLLLEQALDKGCAFDLSDITYYVGHETIMHCRNGTGMPLWQEKIYAILQRNSAQVHQYLRLPQESVIEIGRLFEI